MRIVSLVTDRVKFFNGKNRFLFLAVIVACLTALTIGIPRFVLERSSAHIVKSTGAKPQGCCANVPASLRRMVGTYYTTEDNFKSTLVLNNKGPNQIVVTPILHSQNGQTFNGPPVAVGGQSSYEVDLNAVAASAGREFRSGSFEFTYTGRLLEMGGGLRIVNAEKSLIFDEQMLEPGMKFSSSQLEAVYALPFDSAGVSVIVTNTTSQLLAVQGQATFAGSIVRFPIIGILKPHETSVVDLPPSLVKKASAGAVSINHNGPKGALLAMIHVQDPDRGYSESVNFTDPTHGKTNQLHGAGLRLGSISNDSLKPVIAVRNIGAIATTVAATIPYSKQDSSIGKISLPQLSLAPGEIKLFDTSNPQLRQSDFATAGLEIEYGGAPGSVIATANSFSQGGNQVFALPLNDPKGGLSSTGGYPWFIKDTASTVVFIKNTTNEPQKFMLNIIYPGGRWGYDARTLQPKQTIAVDVRKLRDSQEKGVEGNTIPLDATSGHISWSFFGRRDKVLIGRAQTVDLRNGLASTYECRCMCGWRWGGESRLVPDSITGFPGDVRDFQIESSYRDCFNNYAGFRPTMGSNFTFSVDDPNVASFVAPGRGEALAPGTTYLRASFEEPEWQIVPYPDETWECIASAAAAACAAFCDVQNCPTPEEEQTMETQWDILAGSKHKWQQRLFPVTTSFAGRRIYERSNPANPRTLDTCWFEGSDFPSFTQVTNPPEAFWRVAQGTNEWGPDVIGYAPNAVPYYRAIRGAGATGPLRGTLPCGTRFTQVMYINCGSELVFYSLDQIGADIDATTVSSRRAGQVKTRTY